MFKSLLVIRQRRNCVYRTGYHMVWCSKYRRRILTGPIATRLAEILAEVCRAYGFEIVSLELQPDHVHLFVSLPPATAPALAAKLFKGITARRLRHEFPSLKQLCREDALWSPSYFVGTVGNVSAETVRRYIEEMQSDKRR